MREEIFSNILLLKDFEEIKKYKLTGPFSTGKSMTLFMFSRFYKNAIYINLKVLKKNNENKKKCLEIILSECCRVNINNIEFFKKKNH